MALREIDLAHLLNRAQQDDAICRERLVRHYLPLIRPIARHFSLGQPDLVDDLMQVGAIGLLRAIERFDPQMGKPFEGYAARLVAGEMRHYLRDHVPLVRPPRELVELRSRVRDAQSALMQSTGENASPEAIAAHADLPLAKVEDVLQLEENFHTASLDQELDAPEGTFRYQLVDNRYKSFQLRTEDHLALNLALGKLRAVSREVIEFAFYDDLTQTEIAKRLGISQMQVSRRLKTALGELWKSLNTKLF